jgi:hypothetical protein
MRIARKLNTRFSQAKITVETKKRTKYVGELKLHDPITEKNALDVLGQDFQKRFKEAATKFRALNELSDTPYTDEELQEHLSRIAAEQLGILMEKLIYINIIGIFTVIIPIISAAYVVRIFQKQSEFNELVREYLKQDIPITTYIEVIDDLFASYKETIRLEIQAIEIQLTTPNLVIEKINEYDIQKRLAITKLAELEARYRNIRQKFEKLNTPQSILTSTQNPLPSAQDFPTSTENPTSILADTQQELAQTVGQALVVNKK